MRLPCPSEILETTREIFKKPETSLVAQALALGITVISLQGIHSEIHVQLAKVAVLVESFGIFTSVAAIIAERANLPISQTASRIATTTLIATGICFAVEPITDEDYGPYLTGQKGYTLEVANEFAGVVASDAYRLTIGQGSELISEAFTPDTQGH